MLYINSVGVYMLNIPSNNNRFNYLKFKNNNITNNNVKYYQTEPTATTNSEKNKTFKNAKVAIGIGIIATAIATTAIIAIRNKSKINKIPKELRTLFEELKHEKGENFINKSYSKLKTYMKLDDIAPKKIIYNNNKSAFAVTGGFNPSLNTIEYSNNFKQLSQAEQFELLAHELKHSEQISKIIRSGKMSEYAEAWATHSVEYAKNDPLNINFKLACNGNKKLGKEKEFIENCINNSKQEIIDSMKISHANTLELPKFHPSDKEYKDAEKYIEASRNYIGLDMLGIPSEEYKNNILEKEAYEYGEQMKKYFTIFFKNKR